MNNRRIPGTIEVEGREFRYVSDDGSGVFTNFNRKHDDLFFKVTSQYKIAKTGGVISENCRLETIDNELFHGLSYKGDILGWRKQIELGAKKLNLIMGEIIDDKLVLSDGRSYNLYDCKYEFY